MKKSFRYAFRGFYSCLRTERNFRFHLAAAFYVILAGIVLRITAAEWIPLALCIGAVTGAEILNTAVERLCNALHPGQSADIGLVKDMTAGAVLMFALAAAVTGGLIFFRWDKLERLLAFLREDTLWAVLIVLTVPGAVYFVFRSYKNDSEDSRHHHRRTSQRR